MFIAGLITTQLYIARQCGSQCHTDAECQVTRTPSQLEELFGAIGRTSNIRERPPTGAVQRRDRLASTVSVNDLAVCGEGADVDKAGAFRHEFKRPGVSQDQLGHEIEACL